MGNQTLKKQTKYGLEIHLRETWIKITYSFNKAILTACLIDLLKQLAKTLLVNILILWHLEKGKLDENNTTKHPEPYSRLF